MPKVFSSIASVAICISLAACGSNNPVTDEAVIGSGEHDGTVGVYADGKAKKPGSERIIPTENILNRSDDLLLGALGLKDFQRMIGPKKGCNFKLLGENDTLIVASASANGSTRPQALIRINGEAIVLDATRKGGHGYLAAGPEFRGKDIAVEITPDGGPAKRYNNRSRWWGASAVVRGEGDTVRVYRGGALSCDF